MRAFIVMAVAGLLTWHGCFGGPSQKTPASNHLPEELLPLARQAKEQFEQGNYLEAERLYRQLLEKAPNHLDTLSNLGVVLFRAQKYRLSEETLRQAIIVAPEDAFSHCTLGIVYYTEGKYDEAVNELTKSLAIDANNATAHNYLGITCIQKGWYAAAQKELETATKLKPSFDHIHPLPPPAPVGDFLTPLEMQRRGIPEAPY
jgi:Flp pilus assembly protein TadD